jgi:hypothetical protein
MESRTELEELVKRENFGVFVLSSMSTYYSGVEDVVKELGYNTAFHVAFEPDETLNRIRLFQPNFIYCVCAPEETANMHSFYKDIEDRLGLRVPHLIYSPACVKADLRFIDNNIRIAHAYLFLRHDEKDLLSRLRKSGLDPEGELSKRFAHLKGLLEDTTAPLNGDNADCLKTVLMEDHMRIQPLASKCYWPLAGELAFRLDQVHEILFGSSIDKIDKEWLFSRFNAIRHPKWLQQQINSIMYEHDLPNTPRAKPIIEWINEPAGSHAFVFVEEKKDYALYDTHFILNSFRHNGNEVTYGSLLYNMASKVRPAVMIDGLYDLKLKFPLTATVVVRDRRNITEGIPSIEKLYFVAEQYFPKMQLFNSRKM